MKYFLDCEFDGFGGVLMSMALVPLNSKLPELYLSLEGVETAAFLNEWVRENVAPLIPLENPTVCGVLGDFGVHLDRYFHETSNGTVEIIADWPDDIKYLCERLITGPGTMIKSPCEVRMTVWRVDAYPTTLSDAVQHNALWDARALRHFYVYG